MLSICFNAAKLQRLGADVLFIARLEYSVLTTFSACGQVLLILCANTLHWWFATYFCCISVCIQEPGGQVLIGAVIQLCPHSVISWFSIWEGSGFIQHIMQEVSFYVMIHFM